MVTLAIYMFVQFCTVCLNVGVLKFWSVWTQFCHFLLSEGHFSTVWGHFSPNRVFASAALLPFPFVRTLCGQLPSSVVPRCPPFPFAIFRPGACFSSLICHNHFQHLFEFLTLPNLSASFWNRLFSTHWCLAAFCPGFVWLRIVSMVSRSFLVLVLIGYAKARTCKVCKSCKNR